MLGHTVYGITELALRATGLQAVVEDCATAAKSHDARDKYFQSFVGEFGECSSKSLRSELPALEVSDSFHEPPSPHPRDISTRSF